MADSPSTNTAGAVANPGAPPRDLARTLLHVAWASIALGMLMQWLTLLAAQLYGGSAGAVGDFLRDVSQKITWSAVVCFGLALGTAAAKARAAWAGLAGLLAAPLGFIVARTVQKGVAGAAGVALPAGPAGGVFWAVLLLKAAEYGLFGAFIAWIGRRAWGGLRAHAGGGLVFGAVFGGTFTAVLYATAAAPPPAPKLAAQLVNEIVFPAGCGIVLFAAGKLGQRLSPR